MYGVRAMKRPDLAGVLRLDVAALRYVAFGLLDDTETSSAEARVDATGSPLAPPGANPTPPAAATHAAAASPADQPVSRHRLTVELVDGAPCPQRRVLGQAKLAPEERFWAVAPSFCLKARARPPVAIRSPSRTACETGSTSGTRAKRASMPWRARASSQAHHQGPCFAPSSPARRGWRSRA